MGAPESFSSDVTVSAEKLTADLDVLVADVQMLLTATAGQTGEHIAAVRARAEASLNRVREQLGHVRSDLSRRAGQALDAGAGYVRSNPWSALGIATAAGALIGLLMGRRGSTRP